MHIDWWTLALQAVNVLILIWLLTRFLYRPVMGAIAARQQAADKLLADAQAAKDAAATEAAALKAQNDRFAAETERRQAETRAAIEAERTRLLAKAKTEADAIAQQAAAATAAARSRMAAALEEKAEVLAAQMAEALLRRMPAELTAEAMLQALLAHLRALPEDERRKLAEDGPLHVVTAAPIDDGTRRRYAGALAELLAGGEASDFSVDASLIAGFELYGRHMRVRNSWRADLDEILAALRESGHALSA
ncbi:MAG TPA: hypothetical protein VHA35_21840 [Dongiaceae bacterium]|nr:hypothetical protein [Dongiaceae bacterium]